MSFNQLKVDELKEIVEFFVKEVDPADPEKGPNKKELIAALASGEPDSDNDAPVSWDDYKNIFLVAKDDKPAAPKAPELTKLPEPEKDEKPKSDEPEALVMFTGKNPRLDMAGFTFTKDHPFNSVPVKVAEYLVKNGQFRPALESEVADFYN